MVRDWEQREAARREAVRTAYAQAWARERPMVRDWERHEAERREAARREAARKAYAEAWERERQATLNNLIDLLSSYRKLIMFRSIIVLGAVLALLMAAALTTEPVKSVGADAMNSTTGALVRRVHHGKD